MVVNRTRTTTATYAIYSWGGALDEEGGKEGGWSAEFHSGDWHRMEGPKSRVIANCKTHVGYFYDVASGKMTDAPNAFRGSCGIYDPGDVVSVARIPASVGNSQNLELVKVTDPRFVRRYAINPQGAIVESSWQSANGSPAPCIWTRAFFVADRLPDKAIFAPASLARSIVSDRYRRKPADSKASIFQEPCETRQ